MNLFENILTELHLLLEDVSVDGINNAISGLHPAKITYNDGEPDAKTGIRTIYPVAYGISTAGNPVVRAYQPQGDSKRGTPHWKFFRLDRITNWDTDEDSNFNPSELVGYNPDGDTQIETLYNIAPISKGKEYARPEGEKMSVIKPGPITKQDIVGSEEYNNKENFTADNAVDNIITHLQKKNIDNNPENDYNSEEEKMYASETEPITKNNIGGEENDGQNINNAEEINKLTADNEPVKKSDIEGTEETPEITKSFNDMMGRIDNLHNDNETEENKF